MAPQKNVLAALLPSHIDLGFVGTCAAVGMVIVGTAARIGRLLGRDIDVQRAATTGAFWGGFVGLVIAIFFTILASRL